jgi:hypothetical protein
MQSRNRAIVLGLLLALAAADAQAWGKKKKVEPPPPPPAPVVVAPPPPPPPTVYSGDPALAPQVGAVDLLSMTSPEVQATAQWIRASRDNGNMYYLVLDKPNAQVYFFHPAGHMIAAAPVLLGMGKGDKMLVSNATPMSGMPPNKRITPAGRFVSRLGIDSHGKELLILDYDAALSLHPIVKGTPKENRAGRMASVTAEDNRVSFGCINVPVAFYSNVVSPSLKNTQGVVYILPETSTAGSLFGFQTAPAPVVADGLVTPAAPAAQQVSTTLGVEAAQAAPSQGANK